MSEVSEVPEAARGSNQRSRLADAVTTCVRAYTGRGPTSARVLLNEETVVVVMRDILTKGEQVLVEHGHDEQVLSLRGAYQEAMRQEMTAAIETIMERPVETFMSTNSTDPDYAVEIFILGPAGHESETPPPTE